MRRSTESRVEVVMYSGWNLLHVDEQVQTPRWARYDACSRDTCEVPGRYLKALTQALNKCGGAWKTLPLRPSLRLRVSLRGGVLTSRYR